ncbi:hypothetical protein CMUS01_14031 [Colletotrichum musicola]|uniref:F-box domain-containing protein n=1 Tax=Colletotrichum musicola TaxID=2175873 RepID=A0A8H6J7C3_9PEZI|nr:hypothetical protein CMUS01_14031 [Colletotrichum musicola]
MANMNDLPAEVLREILSKLLVPAWRHVDCKTLPLFDLEEDAADGLKAAARTSRAFHVAATPLLWRHICLTPMRGSGPSAAQLVALIRFWRARPDIASYVQTVFLSWERLYQGPAVIADDDVAFVSALFAELSLRVPDHWHYEEKNTGLLAGLAIILARNVRRLDLIVNSSYFFDCLLAPAETAIRLESLKKIQVHMYGAEDGCNLTPLQRLAPKFDKLNITPVHTSHGLVDWSKITRLKLDYWSMHEAHLVRIIESCGELVELGCTASRGALEPQGIMRALSRHSKSLRKLAIDLGSYKDLGDVSIGPLSMFSKVKKLSISASNAGIGDTCTLQALPENLRALVITEYPSEDEGAEIEWLAEQTGMGKYPDLKQVWLPEWQCDTDHQGPCRGTYVGYDHEFIPDIDLHQPEWGEYDEDEEGCDGGETVHNLQAAFRDAGISCNIGGGYEFMYPHRL